MIFDTDVLIYVQRGNRKAADEVDAANERSLSIQSYMELLQCANNKSQHRQIKEFLSDYGFAILHLSENIGHRASIYIEEYGLSSGLRAGDALIAATATENNMTLVTANAKHFKLIKELEIKIFKPT